MTPEEKQQIEQVKKRRAQVENGDLDYATSYTEKGYCVGRIYEKATGAEVAKMSSLHDVMRGNFFAHAPTDIDFLLSVVKEQEAGGDEDDERLDSMLKKSGIRHTCHRPHDAGTALERLARNINDLAATAMRSACVEKVKAMQCDYGERERDAVAKMDGDAAAYFDGKETAASEIIEALESLSIEKDSTTGEL